MIDARAITMAFDLDTELIISAYETADDIGKVLRIHLAIEGVLERLVTEHSRGKVDRRTTFWSKVNLARAMGVPEKLCVASEALNDLRNKFAHNPKATLANTKSVGDHFLKSVEAIYPKLSQVHGVFERKRAGIRYEFNFIGATREQQIVLAAGILSGVLATIPKMYEFGERSKLVTLSGVML